jgi:ubiquinone/menaquinone biosynthesis C-methylase UbiE
MKKYVKTNQNAFDICAKEYDKNTKVLNKRQLCVRKEFISFLKPDAKILDIGCGPGRDAKIFSNKGFNVVGIDISKNMLQIARKNAPKAKFKQTDLLNMDFQKCFFDAIWFEAALLVIQKKDAIKVLKNIRRILKKEGIFYVSVKEGKGEDFEFDKRYNVTKFKAYYTKTELEILLKKAGFKILKIHILELKPPYHWNKGINIIAVKQ